jgi:hypothetical protein
MLDLVQLGQPASRTRRLLLRLCLLAILRRPPAAPVVSAGRCRRAGREPQLLDPVAKGLCGPVDGRDHGLAAAFAGFGGVAADLLSSLRTDPARPAADGASSPVVRSIRSWPALTGAVSLPGSPASAELPAGGPDPLSSSSGAGLGVAALTAALVLLGLTGRGRARPERSGVISRSYLPLVSPA